MRETGRLRPTARSRGESHGLGRNRNRNQMEPDGTSANLGRFQPALDDQWWQAESRQLPRCLPEPVSNTTENFCSGFPTLHRKAMTKSEQVFYFHHFSSALNVLNDLHFLSRLPKNNRNLQSRLTVWLDTAINLVVQYRDSRVTSLDLRGQTATEPKYTLLYLSQSRSKPSARVGCVGCVLLCPVPSRRWRDPIIITLHRHALPVQRHLSQRLPSAKRQAGPSWAKLSKLTTHNFCMPKRRDGRNTCDAFAVIRIWYLWDGP